MVSRAVEEYDPDRDPRALDAKAHLIAMLFAQFFGLRSLRDIETNLRSHASQFYHLGGHTVSKSALATANASCPVEVFGAVLSALMAQMQRGCRIVTRLKANTRFEIVEDRPVAAGSSILSDRTGYLPKRLAASRSNPMPGLVREIQVVIETGTTLRIFTNDLTASAQDIADLYKRRWAIELFFRWVKQTLKINHFFGTSENAVRIQIAVALISFLLLP